MSESGLPIVTYSLYVPGATSITSFREAAFTAELIVWKQVDEPGLTHSVLAKAESESAAISAKQLNTSHV
jgi:hypothetical protein